MGLEATLVKERRTLWRCSLLRDPINLISAGNFLKNGLIAVVYLARSEHGSAKDFVDFVRSYKKHPAGIAHDLVVVHKGAAAKPGTKAAIGMLFDGTSYSSIELPDDGFDVQAYLKTAAILSHEYVCFLNTYSEIRADGWLEKLVRPLLMSESVGIAGATGSYESLNSSFGMFAKAIWLCAEKRIGYDSRLAAEFMDKIVLHCPEWLSSAPSKVGIAAKTTVVLDTPEIQAGARAHWMSATRPGAPLFGLNWFKPFPNPHVRSNAFVIRRELLNSFGFVLADSKIDCVRFESGLDGLPTRIAQRGLTSVLVGANGNIFDTEEWPESGGFRLGDQSNILVSDNQTRVFDKAAAPERKQLSTLSWGEYGGFDSDLFKELGFPHTRGNLRLTHATRAFPLRRVSLGGISRAQQSKANRPFVISVVIPTRNRLDLLKDAIYTVTAQAHPHWECIVFDNHSDEPIEAYVASLKDERIKYYRADAFLPVTESWNQAIDRATGDYITLLGDDDGLTPDFMQNVEFIVRVHQNPDFIYTALYQYFHPGVAPWEPAGYVIDLKYGRFFESQEDIFKLDPLWACEAVAESLEFRRSFAFNMQAFCFSRDFLESLRIDGRIFHSPFPDYYLANVAMALGKVITVSPKPITIAGVSRKSFGFTLFNKLDKIGNDLLGTNLLSDPVYIQHKAEVLNGPAYNTNYLVTMHSVKKRLGDWVRSGECPEFCV